jgi:hypothetical protein
MQLIVTLTLAATEPSHIKYYDLSQKKKKKKPGRPCSIPVEAKFSAPIQTEPGAHPTVYTTGSLSRGLSGQGVSLTTHHHLAQKLKKE